MQEPFSIHAPREGSDEGYPIPPLYFTKFQSTLPVRGATQKHGHIGPVSVISIHAPREGSDGRLTVLGPAELISIHAPREGSDLSVLHSSTVGHIFQSTLPVRGATDPERGGCRVPRISIHAPREGSDIKGGGGVERGQREISIHAPREGSDPLRHGLRARACVISIHAPREGSDGGIRPD